MTTQTHNPADDLRRLVADGSVSLDALSAMTGIASAKLDALLSGDAPAGLFAATANPDALTPDEDLRVSVLSAQLSEGLTIGDDERVRSIYETLTVECRFTLDNLARLAGVDTDTLRTVLSSPETLPADAKYSLAVKGSYLINAANRARGH